MMLKQKIDEQTRLPVPVIIRSANEMAAVVSDNPLLRRKGSMRRRLHVTFLGEAPKAA